MSEQMTPFTFRSRDGHRLFGILHRPLQPARSDTAVLLLPPGVKMRVAPHGLYVKMAQRFVELGYPVVRVDFHGLGDAEGEAGEELLADLYGATGLGRYVPDTIDAMNHVQEAFGYSRFIASGLCGGALTGLLAAENDPRIVSLVGLSMPVILDGSGIDASKFMTTAQLKGTRTRYLRKFRFWDPKVWRSWVRFFTFQSHYSLITRTIVVPLKARFGATAPADRPAGTDAPVQDNTNPLFAPAFLRMLSTSRRVLLIFAEGDRLLMDFEAKFMARHGAAVAPHAAWFEQHVTPQANHVFALSEWQADMLDTACRWLVRDGLPQAAPARAALRSETSPVAARSH